MRDFTDEEFDSISGEQAYRLTFNPTLVRFNEITQTVLGSEFTDFQSHIGSIQRHEQFAHCRKNGEWFELSSEDIDFIKCYEDDAE